MSYAVQLPGTRVEQLAAAVAPLFVQLKRGYRRNPRFHLILWKYIESSCQALIMSFFLFAPLMERECQNYF